MKKLKLFFEVARLESTKEYLIYRISPKKTTF